MRPQIKTKKITYLKNGSIKGYFKLTDKSVTKFEIQKDGNWFQWGNTTDNLCITVTTLENLANQLTNF